MTITINFDKKQLIIRHYFVNRNIQFNDIERLEIKNTPPTEKYAHQFILQIASINQQGKKIYTELIFEGHINKQFSDDIYQELENLKESLLKIKHD